MAVVGGWIWSDWLLNYCDEYYWTDISSRILNCVFPLTAERVLCWMPWQPLNPRQRPMSLRHWQLFLVSSSKFENIIVALWLIHWFPPFWSNLTVFWCLFPPFLLISSAVVSSTVEGFVIDPRWCTVPLSCFVLFTNGHSLWQISPPDFYCLSRQGFQNSSAWFTRVSSHMWLNTAVVTADHPSWWRISHTSLCLLRPYIIQNHWRCRPWCWSR